MFGKKYKEMYEKLFIESNEKEAESKKVISELQTKVSELKKEIKSLKATKEDTKCKGECDCNECKPKKTTKKTSSKKK